MIKKIRSLSKRTWYLRNTRTGKYLNKVVKFNEATNKFLGRYEYEDECVSKYTAREMIEMEVHGIDFKYLERIPTNDL